MEVSDLYKYYVDSLNFLLHKGREFGKKYPQVASSLQLGEEGTQDPDVKRLIESFALLDARLHHNMHKEKNAMLELLVNSVYPEIAAPIASATMIQLASERPAKIQKGSVCTIKNHAGQYCTFTTMDDVSVGHVKILSAKKMRGSLDENLHKFETCAVIEIQILAPLDSFDAHANPEILADFSRCAIYDYNTQNSYGGGLAEIGHCHVKNIMSQTNPYLALQQYRILPKSFSFITFQFKHTLQPGTCKIVIPYADNMTANVDTKSFLLGCVPAVNLFVKRSEPVKYTSAKDHIEILADIAKVKYKLHGIDKLYFYDPTKRKDVIVSKDDYFYSTEENFTSLKVYLTQNLRTKLAEHIIIFADVLCSDGAQRIDESAEVVITDHEYIKCTNMQIPSEFCDGQKSDKWKVLSLFKMGMQLGALEDFCHEILSLHQIQENGFCTISRSEEVCILDAKKAFSSAVAMDVFRIKLTGNEVQHFTLARALGKVLVDLNNPQKISQALVLDKEDNILDVIGDKLE